MSPACVLWRPGRSHLFRTLCTSVKDHLNPGGFVALEHGHDQQDAVKAMLSDVGLESIVGLKDLAGRPRVTTARMPR